MKQEFHAQVQQQVIINKGNMLILMYFRFAHFLNDTQVPRLLLTFQIIYLRAEYCYNNFDLSLVGAHDLIHGR